MATHPIFDVLGEAIVTELVGAGEYASPIERQLLAGFLVALGEPEAGSCCTRSFPPASAYRFWESVNAAGLGVPGGELATAISVEGAPWALFAQCSIGRYKADFALVSSAGRVVVEADGHDFHERSKEQARHDRGRDRWMQAHGWTVLRFTGSEIWADPLKCGREVVALLIRLEDAEMAQWAGQD